MVKASLSKLPLNRITALFGAGNDLIAAELGDLGMIVLARNHRDDPVRCRYAIQKIRKYSGHISNVFVVDGFDSHLQSSTCSVVFAPLSGRRSPFCERDVFLRLAYLIFSKSVLAFQFSYR